jgi:anthranilate phosphoribosyltransferase
MSKEVKFFSVNDYYKIFTDIINEKLSDEQVKEFLLNLNQSNFSSKAFLGAIKAFRLICKKISAPQNAIDVCGTGGDKLSTLNVSTATALVVAACEVAVAKHGNKAVSSNSGSADVLSQLGININAGVQEIENQLKENNLCFMFAPLYHPAFKNIAKIRKELAVPTIFNFLGPLLNPANTQFQLIGTSKKETMIPMLEALKASGSKKVFIVHGVDGMDEITISDNSYIAKLEDEKVSNIEIVNPENYGISKSPLKSIQGGNEKYNAQKIIDLLDGEKSAYLDIVILNSAFALLVVGKVRSIKEGMNLARSAIESGRAKEILEKLRS